MRTSRRAGHRQDGVGHGNERLHGRGRLSGLVAASIIVAGRCGRRSGRMLLRMGRRAGERRRPGWRASAAVECGRRMSVLATSFGRCNHERMARTVTAGRAASCQR